jgi:hypothetical protein
MPRYVGVRVTDDTRVLVPVTTTFPEATEVPSSGVTSATAGTTGVGVGVWTTTINLTVLLAWLVSRFLAVTSNWLRPD